MTRIEKMTIIGVAFAVDVVMGVMEIAYRIRDALVRGRR
jgi:hypothetical protein